MLSPNLLRSKQAIKITLWGLAINLFLAVFKSIVGFYGHSHGLLADGLHSASDLFSDLMVILAIWMSHQKPDANHPYGHARIETLAAMSLGLLLIITAGMILIDAVHHLFDQHSVTILPNKITLIVAIISILLNEFSYFITQKVAEKIQSDLIQNNAWHHRVDAFSSVIVLIGILGAQWGWHSLDYLAAIIISILIFYVAIRMIIKSASELVDTGLDTEPLTEILTAIKNIPGVKAVHQLRTRLVGGKIFTDVHVQVQPLISVSEGHYIAEQVNYQLIKIKNNAISDVLVHIDSENDNLNNITHDIPTQLPDRLTIENSLKNSADKLIYYSNIQRITLHYFEEKLSIEILFPLSILSHYNYDAIFENYYAVLKHYGQLSLYFCFI